MDRQKFLQFIDNIYSTFAKRNPQDERILSVIFRRVQDLPDDFLPFAEEKLSDYPALPANLGRELRRVLWPEYLEKHPELRARENQQSCPSCSPDVPGFFWAYALDGKRYLLKCACNTRQDLAHLASWTHEKAMQAGLRLHDPLIRERPQPTAHPGTLPLGDIQTQDSWERTRALTDEERDDYAMPMPAPASDSNLAYAGGW